MIKVEVGGYKQTKLTIEDVTIVVREDEAQELLDRLDEHFNFGSTRAELSSQINDFRTRICGGDCD